MHKNVHCWLLATILAVAIVVRFWDFCSVPFTHDEYSALFRTQFPSFSALIEHGVKPDGHPAGVQVFLYYWVGLVGQVAWLVKLPFAIMGVLSVLVVYLLGRYWFSSSAGLLSASYIATLQFPIVYSQIARPYISGMFLSLCMVLFWSYALRQDRKTALNLILFALFASACTYNHYFSLLFAGIVGLTGLFYFRGRYLAYYIASGIIVLLLFLPHWDLFVYQLSVGGVGGWLGEPASSFIVYYLLYLFHYSWAVVLFAIVLASLLFLMQKTSVPVRLMFFAWFILPLAIGYVYSITVSPVLQFSVLLFSFPYLFFVLFGFAGELRLVQLTSIIAGIVVLNVATLIWQREHFSIVYHSIYEQIFADSEDAQAESNGQLCKLAAMQEDIYLYLAENSDCLDSALLLSQDQQAVRVSDYLQAHGNCRYLYAGFTSGVSPGIVPLIQEYFPCLVWERDYFAGSTYLFCKDSCTDRRTRIGLLDRSVVDGTSGWDNVLLPSFSRENHYVLDSSKEWGPSYSDEMGRTLENKNDLIDAYVLVADMDSLFAPSSLLLAASVTDGKGKNIFWHGVSFQSATIVRDSAYLLQISLKCSDIDLGRADRFSFSLWNKGHGNFCVRNFEVFLRSGNKYVYSMTEPI